MEKEEFSFTDGCFFKKEPIHSPEAVIKEFYMIYDLEEVKLIIWKMFKGAMSSEVQVFDLPAEGGDTIFFLETFIMLNMAVHELNQRWNASD